MIAQHLMALRTPKYDKATAILNIYVASQYTTKYVAIDDCHSKAVLDILSFP